MSIEIDRIPDKNLRTLILAALAADERTAGAALRVGVLNGIAHLAGTIDSLESRAVAQELAQAIPGVMAVVNRIAAPGAPRPARTIDVNLENK